jgi:predicted esterase
MAFSSGYLTPVERVGKPPVFLSHGTADPIFPIELTGRSVARSLRKEGYEVTMREFDGRHAFPPDVAADAMRWLKAAPGLTPA